MTTLAVLLAAGAGSRFTAGNPDGGHKLLAVLRGRPVVAHALSAMVAAGLDECAIVTGAVDLAAVHDESLTELLGRATVLHNPDWASGQRSSLVVALTHARAHGHNAVVVGLADQPFVTAASWRRVADSDAPITAASYGGRRGNPVRIDSTMWDELAVPTADTDSGARSLMVAHPDKVRLVECDGSDADIDTVEDLRAHETRTTHSKERGPTTWT